MKKCPYCSSELLDDAEFCLYCMRQLREKEIIKKKAKKLHIYAIFCSIVVVLLLCLLPFLFIGPSADRTCSYSQPSASRHSESEDTVTPPVPDASDEDSSSGASSSDSSEGSISSGSSDKTETQKPQSPGTTTPIGSKDDDNNSDEKVEEDDSPVVSPPTQDSSSDSSNTDEQEPETFNTRVVSGGVEITGINTYNSSGVYEIPSQLDGLTVIGIADEAFKYESIKSITLPSSLKYIGELSFANCQQLTEIVIPENVTAIKNGAFVNCKKLSKIYIASKNIEIHNYAFSSEYQRDVSLTIYAASSVMDSLLAQIQWNAEFEEWNG